MRKIIFVVTGIAIAGVAAALLTPKYRTADAVSPLLSTLKEVPAADLKAPTPEEIRTSLGQFISFSLVDATDWSQRPTTLHFAVTAEEAGRYTFSCTAWAKAPSGKLWQIGQPFSSELTLPAGESNQAIALTSDTAGLLDTASCTVNLDKETAHTLVSDHQTYQMGLGGWEGNQMLGVPEGLPALEDGSRVHYAFSYIFGNDTPSK
jgi:hypothetical protein